MRDYIEDQNGYVGGACRVSLFGGKYRYVLCADTCSEPLDLYEERTDSSDQPEIVRCRDCWNFNDDYEPAECRMTGLDVAGYDFCSQGERREP